MPDRIHATTSLLLPKSAPSSSPGAACRVAREEMAADTAHVRRLSKRMVEGVRAQLEHVVFNGDEDNTYEGCINLSFAYVEVSKGMGSEFPSKII